MINFTELMALYPAGFRVTVDVVPISPVAVSETIPVCMEPEPTQAQPAAKDQAIMAIEEIQVIEIPAAIEVNRPTKYTNTIHSTLDSWYVDSMGLHFKHGIESAIIDLELIKKWITLDKKSRHAEIMCDVPATSKRRLIRAAMKHILEGNIKIEGIKIPETENEAINESIDTKATRESVRFITATKPRSYADIHSQKQKQEAI